MAVLDVTTVTSAEKIFSRKGAKPAKRFRFRNRFFVPFRGFAPLR